MVQTLKSKAAYLVAGLVVVLLLGASPGVINWKQINSVFRHGAGAYGQASDGTGTSGHCVKYDANGNVTDAGAACGTSSLGYPGAGIPNSTGSAWGTSYGAQGTDSNVLTAGTVSGISVALCTDSNGGATTSSCPSGISSLTTTGTSGAATFSGGVLNIPVYSSGAGATAPYLGFLNNSPPNLGSFSTSGSAPGSQATSYSSGQYAGLSVGTSASSQVFYHSLPSAPWTVYCAISLQADQVTGTQFELQLLNSSAVSQRALRLVNVSGAWRRTVSASTDVYTGPTGNVVTSDNSQIFFLRIQDNSSTVTYSISSSYGWTWPAQYSESVSGLSLANYGVNLNNSSGTFGAGAMIWTLYTTTP